MDEHDLMEEIKALLIEATTGGIEPVSEAWEREVATVGATHGTGPSFGITLEDGTTFVVTVTQTS